MGEREAVHSVFDTLLATCGQTMLLIRDGHLARAYGQASLGYGPDLPLGRHIAEYAHPDDVPTILDFIERTRSGEDLVGTLRLRARTGDGGWALTEGFVRDCRDDPDLCGTVLLLRRVQGPDTDEDFTFPSVAQRAEAGTLASLAEVVPAAILTTDLNGFVVYSNLATQEVLGYPAEQLSGAGWTRLVHPDDVKPVARASNAALQRGESSEQLFRVEHPEGERWILGRFAPLRHDDRITGLIASFDDVTAQRAVEQDLTHRATHDPLTELPNRTLLVDRLRQALRRSKRTNLPVTVLFIDLDGFKAINDDLGHAVGDDVLVRVAQRLRAVVRGPDTVARLGGDEFVVICEGLGADEARHLARRLQAAIPLPDGDDDPIGGVIAGLEASIGIALVGPDASPEDAIHHADLAMYHAKETNPGGIEVVTPHLEG